MTAKNEVVINPDEKAVDAGQFSLQNQAEQASAAAGYFVPNTLAGLARQGRLYVIAEGLAGSAQGHVAAQYAVQKVIHTFYTSSIKDPHKRLLEAIRQANTDIFERNAQYPKRRPLATTFAATLIHNNKLFVATVGDNQIFVAWDQDIEQLAPEIPAAGEEEEKQPSAPESLRHRISSTGLGLEKEVETKTSTRRLFAGDNLVMCSGGLTGYLQKEEIARAVNRHPTDQAMRRLIALASERSFRDPCAISVARVLSEPVAAHPLPEMPLPAAPKWANWNTPPKPFGQQSTTDTRPMGTASAPAHPRFSRPPGFMPDQKSGKNRKWAIAAGLIILLLLCAAPLVAARYLIPAEMLTTLPFAKNPGLIFAVPEEAAGTSNPAITRLPDPTEPAATTAPKPPPATEAAAESNSPVATPENAPVSPVSTPATAAATISSADTTLSLTATPSPTPLPLPTLQLPANCENRARFVRDATIPDGTELAPGETFEKAWIVLNADTCPWGPGYTVRLVDGDPMGASTEILLRDTAKPDENYEIRIPMTAPAGLGEHRGEWQLHDLNGEPFGPDLYLEIEVVPPDLTTADPDQLNVLYDFIENAGSATWTSEDLEYLVQETSISDTLELPVGGIVATGIAQLRGNRQSSSPALLTYPNQDYGYIEGRYRIDTPLQPTDAIAARIGFTKLSILSDDGVTFEATFTPDGGEEQIIFSTPVEYRDSPVTEIESLGDIPAGSTGIVTLRVLGGDSLSQDWALWISARLVRPG